MGVELGMRLLLRLSWVVCTSVVLMYTVLVLLAAAPLRLEFALHLKTNRGPTGPSTSRFPGIVLIAIFFGDRSCRHSAVLLIVGENIGVSLELPLAQSGRSHGSKVECLEFYASYSIGQRAGELGGCSVGESETLVSDHPAREGTEYQTNGRRTIGRSLRLYMVRRSGECSSSSSHGRLCPSPEQWCADNDAHAESASSARTISEVAAVASAPSAEPQRNRQSA